MENFFVTQATCLHCLHRTTRPEQALAYVLEHAEENNPDSVLDAIDTYSQQMFLINIGSEKGKIFDNLLQERKPKIALELGAYCGYRLDIFLLTHFTHI